MDICIDRLLSSWYAFPFIGSQPYKIAVCAAPSAHLLDRVYLEQIREDKLSCLVADSSESPSSTIISLRL